MSGEDQDIEQRLVLHSYTREKEKQLEAHPELSGMEEFIDIEALKLAGREEQVHGRIVSSPRTIAKQAAQNVRTTFKKKTSGKGDGDDGMMSDTEYANFFSWKRR
ncbi:MAG: hypothetical protein ABSC04_20625 [Syntrophobacteraceae bacterium]|jgi:hypothetical protein